MERDRIRGLDLIEKAAMQGDAKGAANLGWLLAAGEGVERDPEKAVYWLGKAADAGLPVAMMQLAAIYAERTAARRPPTRSRLPVFFRRLRGKAWLMPTRPSCV